MADKTTLAIAFVIGIFATIAWIIFLAKHPAYGKAKKLVEHAKKNGYFTNGHVIKRRTIRGNLRGPQEVWDDTHYATYKYMVSGREYKKRCKAKGNVSFNSDETIYYDPKNPAKAYIWEEYRDAKNPRAWWAVLILIPIFILVIMAVNLFRT